MSTSIQLFEKFGLAGTNFNYANGANAFLSESYTSNAGNSYWNSVRVADGIIIKEDVGLGYSHKFLNGIKIFSAKDKTLIGEGDYHCCYYSDGEVKRKSTSILLSTLKEAAHAEGKNIDVENAKKIIGKMIDEALNADQRDVLRIQSDKYKALGA